MLLWVISGIARSWCSNDSYKSSDVKTRNHVRVDLVNRAVWINTCREAILLFTRALELYGSLNHWLAMPVYWVLPMGNSMPVRFVPQVGYETTEPGFEEVSRSNASSLSIRIVGTMKVFTLRVALSDDCCCPWATMKSPSDNPSPNPHPNRSLIRLFRALWFFNVTDLVLPMGNKSFHIDPKR